MRYWRVILLAALAVLLLLAGLVILILPDPYEGPMVKQIDEDHAIHAIDLLGLVLLILGSALSWSAGALWQRHMYAP
jgi:drug/metabolite transporter (DMT)-like permease